MIAHDIILNHRGGDAVFRRLNIMQIKLRDAVVADACQETGEGFFLEVLVALLGFPFWRFFGQADAGSNVLCDVSARLCINRARALL